MSSLYYCQIVCDFIYNKNVSIIHSHLINVSELFMLSTVKRIWLLLCLSRRISTKVLKKIHRWNQRSKGSNIDLCVLLTMGSRWLYLRHNPILCTGCFSKGGQVLMGTFRSNSKLLKKENLFIDSPFCLS